RYGGGKADKPAHRVRGGSGDARGEELRAVFEDRYGSGGGLARVLHRDGNRSLVRSASRRGNGQQGGACRQRESERFHNASATSSFHRLHPLLERTAHGELKHALRFKQACGNPLRLLLNHLLQLRQNFRLIHTGRQGSHLRRAQIPGPGRRGNRIAQSQIIVGVINPEGRLHDGELNQELDSGRGVRGEIRAGDQLQVRWDHRVRELRVRKLLLQLREGRRIELQLRRAQRAVDREVVEKVHFEVRTDQRNPVLEIRDRLEIAAGPGGN